MKAGRRQDLWRRPPATSSSMSAKEAPCNTLILGYKFFSIYHPKSCVTLLSLVLSISILSLSLFLLIRKYSLKYCTCLNLFEFET
jgi:hypothetical protein